MKLIVTEKNIAAKKLAEILAVGKPKTDKVYNTPVYTFRRDGEDWITIGLKGHILGVDFPPQMVFDDGTWEAVWDEDHRATPARIPASLAHASVGEAQEALHRRRRRPQDAGSSRRCRTSCGRRSARCPPSASSSAR